MTTNAGELVLGIGDVVRLTGGADGALHEASIDPDALVLVKRGTEARLR
jgi:hypothetical protein